MAPREHGQCIAQAQGELGGALAAFLQTQRQPRVRYILAGGAEMEVASGLGRDLLPECAHKRDGQRAGIARLLCERGYVECRPLACDGDRFGMLRRNDADAGASACKRRFEARHAYQQVRVAERLCATLVGEDELEAQKSKKTVSFLPCRITFHSRTSALRRATSVERRSAGTSARTGSSALAGSSGKYMRVCSCLRRPLMKIVTERCGACSLPPVPGTRPGLIVLKRNAPLSSVSERP